MANLVQDYSIEAGNWYDYWPEYETSGSSTDSQDSVEFHQGSKSFKIVCAGLSDAGRYQNQALTAGTYQFSGWVKTGSGVTNAHMLIHDSGFGVLAGGHVTSADQDWAKISGSFTLGGSDTCTIRIGLGSFGATSLGTAYFDEIYLENTGIKTIDNLSKSQVKVVDGLAIASMKTWNGLA